MSSTNDWEGYRMPIEYAEPVKAGVAALQQQNPETEITRDLSKVDQRKRRS